MPTNKSGNNSLRMEITQYLNSYNLFLLTNQIINKKQEIFIKKKKIINFLKKIFEQIFFSHIHCFKQQINFKKKMKKKK